jgi:hypothetical protein
MASHSETEQQARHRLKQLRPILLALHKALLEAERVNYEQAYGPIASKGEYFRLVLGHEQFNWLRPISQLIVRIDEVLAAKQPEAAESAKGLVVETHSLLNSEPTGNPAQQHYTQVRQQHADIADMHATLMQLLV